MQIRFRIVTYPPRAARTHDISTGGRDNVGMCGGYRHCALIESTGPLVRSRTCFVRDGGAGGCEMNRISPPLIS